MNSRGLTELVVLNVLLTNKVIDSTVYTVLIIVSLITTIVTSPLLSLVDDHRRLRLVPFVPTRATTTQRWSDDQPA